MRECIKVERALGIVTVGRLMAANMGIRDSNTSTPDCPIPDGVRNCGARRKELELVGSCF